MNLLHLTFVVLFYLCAGTFLALGFLKQTQVGRKFFVIHGLGISGLALAAYLIGRTEVPGGAAVWIGIFVLFSAIFSLAIGRQNKLATVSFFLALIAGIGGILLDIAETVPTTVQSGVIANSLLSSALLGFMMAAMLLGHWYLNQPKLSIDELRRLTILLIALTVVRFLFGIYGTATLLLPLSETEMYRYLVGNPGIFVLMRFFWGLLGPLLLSYFIWGTVKISSTQSATGILYVGVVFVLIGEILSQYLAFYHGIAF